MFDWMGKVLSQYWIGILACWLVLFVGLRFVAPPFEDVAKGGEFVFLPESMASRQGERLKNTAFPEQQTTSNIVIVAHRDENEGLTDDDRDFLSNTLKPELEQIRDDVNSKSVIATKQTAITGDQRVMTEIHLFSDPGVGDVLVSGDRKSSLITIDLALDFQDTRNWQPVQQVADVLKSHETDDKKPKGLQLALTGSATLGRDLSQAEAASARHIGPLTILMVIVLLCVIYRAPLLALVPLLTLFLAVDVSLHLLTLLAQRGYVPIFRGLQEYTTVISYGPGVDYCLFLIARYKENLEKCVPTNDSLVQAIGQVGAAIVASAATVICGIGMLTFAQFGKFHEAGIGISITLIITLIATLTLTPALLFMTGRWAFWPKPGIRCNDEGQQVTENGDVAVQRNLFQPLWAFMGGIIERHPMRLLLVTSAAMSPFVVVGLYFYGSVNYGLLESLPQSSDSATGAHVLEKHFPSGITGPIEVLVQNSSVDFREEEGIKFIRDLSERLMKRSSELKIADIRSVASPLGLHTSFDAEAAEESFLRRTIERRTISKRGVEHYVSSAEGFEGHLTLLEVIINENPFSLGSIQTLNKLAAAIPQELPPEQTSKTELHFVGPTASVRDVNLVSYSDQWRIYVLVVASVFAILVILLRSITLSLYLIATVLFSYLATLGVTWLVFYALDPKGFVGLDWTVPLFLFVVLIAVGEDYNIFLVTRIHEEQRVVGGVHGITIALTRTGGIITSCGLIMAGTFASLLVGSLVRMQQLGLALAFGVLLDTFVIRPILVPAYLMLMERQPSEPPSQPATKEQLLEMASSEK